jgi:hypothetical protein
MTKLLHQTWSCQASDGLEPEQFKSLLIRRRWTELMLENPPPAPSAARQATRETAVAERPGEQGDDDEEPPKPEFSSAQIAAAKRKHKQQMTSLNKQRKEKQRRMEALQQRLAKLNGEKHELVTQLKQVGRRWCSCRPAGSSCTAPAPPFCLLPAPARPSGGAAGAGPSGLGGARPPGTSTSYLRHSRRAPSSSPPPPPPPTCADVPHVQVVHVRDALHVVHRLVGGGDVQARRGALHQRLHDVPDDAPGGEQHQQGEQKGADGVGDVPAHVVLLPPDQAARQRDAHGLRRGRGGTGGREAAAWERRQLLGQVLQGVLCAGPGARCRPREGAGQPRRQQAVQQMQRCAAA